MKVTENEDKDSQLPQEGSLHVVSAEQRENAEASIHSKIAETNILSKCIRTDKLLELILRSENLNQAYLKVKSNKGVCGVQYHAQRTRQGTGTQRAPICALCG